MSKLDKLLFSELPSIQDIWRILYYEDTLTKGLSAEKVDKLISCLCDLDESIEEKLKNTRETALEQGYQEAKEEYEDEYDRGYEDGKDEGYREGYNNRHGF